MDVVTLVLAKNYTDKKMSEGLGLKFVLVDDLPETGETSTIYLKKKRGIFKSNLYDEYIWLETSKTWELIGRDELDLSKYTTLEYLEENYTKTINDFTQQDFQTFKDNNPNLETLQVLAFTELLMKDWEELEHE